jgi:hypothetical protein
MSLLGGALQRWASRGRLTRPCADQVAEGRGWEVDRVRPLAKGKVYTGKQVRRRHAGRGMRAAGLRGATGACGAGPCFRKGLDTATPCVM